MAKGNSSLIGFVCGLAAKGLEGFWQTYINRNPHLLDESLIALRDEQAVFSIAVVEGGEYRYFDGIDDHGSVTLNAATLAAFGHDKPFSRFSNGALAFGTYFLGAYRFQVLWATIYAED